MNMDIDEAGEDHLIPVVGKGAVPAVMDCPEPSALDLDKALPHLLLQNNVLAVENHNFLPLFYAKFILKSSSPC